MEMEDLLDDISDQVNNVNSDTEDVQTLSLTEHQVLVKSAKKIVKNARKYFINKKPRILPKTSHQSDPLQKYDKDVIPGTEEQNKRKPLQVPIKKIILVPRDPSNTIKIISMPQRLPPRATVASVRMLQTIKSSFSVPTELVPSTSKAIQAIAVPKTLIKHAAPIHAQTSPNNYYADLRRKWMSNVASREKFKLIKRLKDRNNKPIVLRKIRKTLGESDGISKSLGPESFPKAIFYPDAQADEKNKLLSKKPLTFSKVFEEAAKHSLNEQASKQKFIKTTIKPSPVLKKMERIIIAVSESDSDVELTKEAAHELSDEDLFEVVLEDSAPVVEKKLEIPTKKKINYLIAQNLLASDTDKAVPFVHDHQEVENICVDEDEHQFETVTDDAESLQQNQPIGGFSTFPLRPEINCMLMENIAYYRVIAQYLLKKKNIPAIDFENADKSEIINFYRSLKR